MLRSSPAIVSLLVLLSGCVELGEDGAEESEEKFATGLTFAALADSRVAATTPNTNYGSSTKLASDGSPLQHSYLRFSVSGLTTTVQSARVRCYVTDAT